MEYSGVVLLLGAPGAGKRLLSQTHSQTVYDFVNVGEQLRTTGKVQKHLQHPTHMGKTQLAQMARGILEEACRGFKEHMAQSRGGIPSVLLLEFVKELDDAFIVMEVLQQYGIRLKQVLYVSEAEPSDSGTPGTVELLRACLSSKTCSPSGKYGGLGGRGESSKDTDQRQSKWQRNAAGLIELFSAVGVLAEVTAAQLPHKQQAPAAAAAGTAWGPAPQEQAAASLASAGSTGPSTSSSPDSEPPKGTLAALGYAAADSPGSMWLAQDGWCSSSTGSLRAVAALLPNRLWLGFQDGSCVENVVTAVHIEPVVSQRLITSVAERDRVLNLAASYTGLYNSKELPSSSGSSSSSSSSSLAVDGISSCLHKVFAVPLQSITSKADARWVAVPGRYMVSHKCDGTRYLLVATGEEGTCYLVNRTGMVYRFPYGTAGLPYSADASGSSVGNSTLQESGCSSKLCAADSLLQPVSQGSSNSSSNRCQAGSSSSDSGSSSNTNVALTSLHPGMQGKSSDSAGPETHDVPAAAASTSTSSVHAAAASPVHNLPAGTILDGELVWQPGLGADRLGRFLVFDALSIGGSPVWQLPLQDRLRQLQEQLGLQVADTGLLPLSQPAASTAEADTASNSSRGGSSSSQGAGIKPFSIHIEASSSNRGRYTYMSDNFTAKVDAVLSKKQQAPPPPADRLMLLLKPHYDVTTEALQQLQEEAEAGQLPFATDGLVFTPKAMPYGLGMAQLLTKWQPVQQTVGDLTGKALQQQQHGGRLYEIRSALEAQGLSSSAATTTGKQLQQGFARLPSNLVYECVQLSIDDISMTGAVDKIKASTSEQKSARLQAPKVVWLPQSVRWDKATGNHSSVLEQIQQRLKHPGLYCLSHEQLLQSVREVQQWVKPQAAARDSNTGSAPAETAADESLTAAAASSSSRQQLHPARAVPFDDMYADIQAAVSAGVVEVSVDDVSGLEVFCYNMAHGPPSSLLAAMCRGLVLHPGSKSVVATPFVRFDNLKPDQVGLRTQVSGAPPSQAAAAASSSKAARGGGARGRDRGSGSIFSSNGQGTAYGTGGTAELELAKQVSQEDYNSQQLCQTWGSQPPATASFKLDGSLIIAFVWQGQLYTCTRRRMDSEQAIWAHKWLQEHVAAGALQPGWTYLFEAIYSSNTHVIQYPFEGLVLLGAVDPAGAELPSAAARQQLAQQLGVLAVPCIDGTLPELTHRLAQGTSATAVPKTDSSRTELTLDEVLGITPPQPAPGDSISSTQGLAPAMFEGWVVQDLSSGQRYKMVQEAFKVTGDAASTRLHPLAVWDAVYCGCSRAELMQGLPDHYQAELDAILAALQQQFRMVQEQLDADLQAAWLDAAAAASSGSARTPQPGAAAAAAAAGAEEAAQQHVAEQQGSSTRGTSSSTGSLRPSAASRLDVSGALPAQSTAFNPEPAGSSAAAAAPAGSAEDAGVPEDAVAGPAAAAETATAASNTTDDASTTAADTAHTVSTYRKASSKQTSSDATGLLLPTKAEVALDSRCASTSLAPVHSSLAGGSSSCSTVARQPQVGQTTDTATTINNNTDSTHQHHTWHSSAAGSSSRTGACCWPVTADGISTQAYAEALEYALLKGTARVSSMFKQDGSKLAPSLRGLLLSFIKPSTAGTLPGYQPSEAFQQTYCKGWAKGPKQGRVSVQSPEPLILTKLTDQALMGMLGLLQQRREIGSALLVCRAWSRLLLGDAEFQQKAQQAAAGMPAKRYHTWRTGGGSDARSWYDSDDDFGDDRYRSYSDHSGYGSV